MNAVRTSPTVEKKIKYGCLWLENGLPRTKVHFICNIEFLNVLNGYMQKGNVHRERLKMKSIVKFLNYVVLRFGCI